VYSNPVTATITGTAATTTVYATTTAAPASGAHTDLIPIPTNTNTPGTAIAMPTDATINSLLMSPGGTRAFLGSSKGLVVVDVSANTVLATVSNALGTALAVSPNSQFVISSDAGAGKVYVYDSVNNLVTTLTIAGATRATFTTDSFKAYIVAGSTLYQYSPSLTLRTIPMAAAANDVAVNSSGQFAYVAGGVAGAVAARSTCRNDSTWAPEGSVGTGTAPDLIASASTGALLAVEGSSSEMDKITPTIDLPTVGTSCPPTLTSNALVTKNFSVGLFIPQQIIVTPDGAKAYVTSNLAGMLLVFDNASGLETAAAIPLANSATTSTGGALLDSSKVYVGGSDNAVHVIDVASGTEGTPISLSFKPDLVAVRPH
jgi:WD40 repeat protein